VEYCLKGQGRAPVESVLMPESKIDALFQQRTPLTRIGIFPQRGDFVSFNRV
jgi:hypothetical protein